MKGRRCRPFSRPDMPTYAIGDLQGCFSTLQKLLARIAFDDSRDKLWFVGDLVNRGADSLACLRFVRDLGDRAVTVLGNHDLHLLAVSEGLRKAGKNDTLSPILEAADGKRLLKWLRQQKLLHCEGSFVLVHAGLLPGWDMNTCVALAREVEDVLSGINYRELLANMYGDQPDRWNPSLSGQARWRLTVNAMTRLRVLRQGAIDHQFKGELGDLPPELTPWFQQRHPSLGAKTIVAGHWSALGLVNTKGFVALDTGCVWGRQLTAVRLEDREIFQVDCAETHLRLGWD